MKTQKLAIPIDGRKGQEYLAKTGSLGTNWTGELGREEAGARGTAAGSAAAARQSKSTQARARCEARGGGGATVRQHGLGHGGGLG